MSDVASVVRLWSLAERHRVGWQRGDYKNVGVLNVPLQERWDQGWEKCSKRCLWRILDFRDGEGEKQSQVLEEETGRSPVWDPAGVSRGCAVRLAAVGFLQDVPSFFRRVAKPRLGTLLKLKLSPSHPAPVPWWSRCEREVELRPPELPSHQCLWCWQRSGTRTPLLGMLAAVL